MKILVTGAAGQLGADLVNELIDRGHECIASDYYENEEIREVTHAIDRAPYVKMDIMDAKEVNNVITQLRPEAVIHCAAWTAVDDAEDNVKFVFKLNVDGTANIAMGCMMTGAKMMYISTDYVFNGKGEKPWLPDCEDFEPLSVYGSSKLQGETMVRAWVPNSFIVRIAWVFGKNGNNFVRTMLRLAETHDSLRVVNDQIGTPTYTKDLAVLLADMIVTDKYGAYHATNEGGFISWYDFACEIFRQAGKDVKVTPVTTEEYGVSKAVRPENSRLDKSKLSENGFNRLPEWQDALARYLKEIDS